MSTANLLSRLSGVRQTGPDRWFALCPAHDDKFPSLSIRSTSDGKVLLHCFAGCDPEDILAAIGLAWKDLYPNSWQEAEARGLAHGHRRLRKTLAEITQVDYARHVLVIAAADVEAGHAHDIQDRATIHLAAEIMQEARRHG